MWSDGLDLVANLCIILIYVMIWVCLKLGSAAKFYVSNWWQICWFALVKLCIHAGSALPSSVCTLMHDFWWYSSFWILLQSSVFCSVFWWLHFVDRVSVIQNWVIQRLMMLVLIDYVLQWYWWAQYENWMKCGLQIMVLCFKSIQSENLWNVVPGGRKRMLLPSIGQHLRTSTSVNTRAKGVVAPFQ